MGWLRSNRPDDRSREPADRLATITPGVPGRCPVCDGFGYIDNIDLGHRYQIQHCKDCAHRWEYLFDEDGAVVGLTELDERGNPRTRTRIRPLRASAPSADLVDDAVDEDETAEEPAGPVAVTVDEVIDLREPAPVPPAPAPARAVEAAAVGATAPRPEEMSPAEWLRHSLGR